MFRLLSIVTQVTPKLELSMICQIEPSRALLIAAALVMFPFVIAILLCKCLAASAEALTLLSLRFNILLSKSCKPSVKIVFPCSEICLGLLSVLSWCLNCRQILNKDLASNTASSKAWLAPYSHTRVVMKVTLWVIIIKLQTWKHNIIYLSLCTLEHISVRNENEQNERIKIISLLLWKGTLDEQHHLS